jgi:hypothetical protein
MRTDIGKLCDETRNILGDTGVVPFVGGMMFMAIATALAIAVLKLFMWGGGPACAARVAGVQC